MKFLCDRCKTRYSIGDERVRGKILKIRCKNCANVITVREGMPEPDAVASAAPGTRRSKDTTEAPTEAVSTTANGSKPGALGAAFASAMTKPPPALEEEWYVSIDGDQSGPFSLGDAQRWVSSKPFDAELHCWSEGFDDWLPVDKVSHFRGLRKKPVAPAAPPPVAAPPPIPKIAGNGTGPARAIAPRIPEEEHTPKPLFAATMASLEKSAAAPQVAIAAGPASAGGAAAVGALRVEARAPAAKPVTGTNGTHGPKLGLAGATAARFDASEPARSDTHADDEPPTTRADEPAPRHLKSLDSSKKTGPNDAFLDSLAKERNERKAAQKAEAAKPAVSLAALEASSPPAIPPAPIPSAPSPTEAPTLRADEPSASPKPAVEDDDMEIGEVSRVVNLADLMRQPKRAATQAGNRTGAIGRVTAPVGRVTGPVPKLGATGAVPRLNATAGVPLIDAVDAIPGEQVLPPVEPEPEKHSRRGLILLLVGAALLLGAGAVILIVKLSSGEDVTGLGGQYEVNTERPDLVVRRPGDPGPGSAETPQNPFIPKQPKITVRPPNQGSGTKPVDPVPPPAGNSLKTDEIEAMARSTSSTTTACFRRASKGADDIILSDVKKIRVAFKVNPDGTVAPSSVDLSEKRSATLSSCLQRMVAGWKFRPNAGGDFGFILAKPD